MDKNIAQLTLESALKNGADHCRVTLSEGEGGTITLLNGDIENISSSSSASIVVNIFANGRYGTFSTNRLTPGEIRNFIPGCVESTLLLTPDEHRKLPDKESYYHGMENNMHLSDPKFSEITFEKKREVLEKVYAQKPMGADPGIISVGNSYSDALAREYMIDSQGLEVEDCKTIFSVDAEYTLRGEGDSKPQNGWGDGATYFDEIPLSEIGETAFQRTAGMLNSRKADSGRYNIVMERSVSSKAIGAVLAALSGAAIHQKNSFLMDSLGKSLFPSTLSIADRPHIIGALGSCAYDEAGVATREREIITNGIVESYYLDTYYSNKLGLPRTVPSPTNPVFASDSGIGEKEILKRVGNGILITGFNGGNSNPLTGDFSYGIEGFLFENGERLYPIRENNISGNFIQLWEKNTFIGNDPLKFIKWQIPTLSFTDIDISGV